MYSVTAYVRKWCKESFLQKYEDKEKIVCLVSKINTKQCSSIWIMNMLKNYSEKNRILLKLKKLRLLSKFKMVPKNFGRTKIMAEKMNLEWFNERETNYIIRESDQFLKI